MTLDRIRQLLLEGEGLTVEYKECVSSLGRSVWETVCAFSNRFGGHLILGVNDNGTILGVNRNAVKQMKKDFVNTLNNPQKMSPLLHLNLTETEIDGALILHVYIPPSAQVQSTNGRIFDRNEDADQDITKFADRITQIAITKSSAYTEREVFPYVTDNEIRFDLVEKAKKLATCRTAEHPWRGMEAKEILQSAGLIETDWRTGKTGYNLAAILLFGRDDVIRSCAPGIVTDALLRRDNVDRYDDRLYIETNLIEQYDALMAFISKHTNDPFVLIGDVRVSVRSWIARELVSNILAHREYSRAHLARLIIDREKIYTENWNRPKTHGQLDPNNFTPDSKNPLIAKFFMNIGYADQLGSGMRNMYYYSKLYSGKEPQLVEGDVFTTIVPLPSTMQVTPQVMPQVAPQVTPQDEVGSSLLKFCATPRSREEMQAFVGIMDRKHFRSAILKPLLASGRLKMTVPDKPNSRNQKYVRNE